MIACVLIELTTSKCAREVREIPFEGVDALLEARQQQ